MKLIGKVPCGVRPAAVSNGQSKYVFMLQKQTRKRLRGTSVYVASPFPGSASTVRVRLWRPSEVLAAQLWEHGDQEDQDPATQSAGQGTSQAASGGGGSPSQWWAETSSPAGDKDQPV